MTSNLDFSGQHGVQSLIVALLIVGFVAFRMLGERRMSLGRLVLFPLVLVALAGVNLWTTVGHSWEAAAFALVGALAGWGLGELVMRTQTVRLDPLKPSLVIVKGSAMTVVLFVGSFALRAFLSALIGQHALHGVLGNVSGALLAFGIALVVMRNFGIYRAALRLQRRARRAGEVAHG